MVLIDSQGGRRLGNVVVHDSLQPFNEGCATKIEEEADTQIEKPEVGQQLFSVDRGESVDRLELYGYSMFNEKVEFEAVDEDSVIEFERDDLLPLDTQAAPTKLLRKQGLIYRLEQTRSHAGVQADGSVDDVSRDLVEIQEKLPLETPRLREPPRSPRELANQPKG
jgi:hypothetical protein